MASGEDSGWTSNHDQASETLLGYGRPILPSHHMEGWGPGDIICVLDPAVLNET